MCFGGPSAPAPVPQKQAARSPSDTGLRAADDLRRRMGLAATILTPNSMAPATTTATGKTVLGG